MAPNTRSDLITISREDLQQLIDNAVKSAVDHCLREAIKATKEEVLASTTTLLDKLEHRLFNCEKQIDDLQASIDSVQKTATESAESSTKAAWIQTKKIDQSKRRNDIIVYGLPTTKDVNKGKITDLLSSRLKITIDQKDLASVYPVGKFAYVAKFHDRKLRDSVLSKRRLLKSNTDQTV